jgi:uncharacterized protein YciI
VKYVVTYEGVEDMARVRELFPAHQAKWQPYAERGELLMIGPFGDPRQGAMGIFTTREAAEAFVKEDPFVVEGLVKAWHIREWREALR